IVVERPCNGRRALHGARPGTGCPTADEDPHSAEIQGWTDPTLFDCLEDLLLGNLRRGCVAYMRASNLAGSTSMSVGARVKKKRIVTGVRPTGPLHLGHYAGALE